MALCLHACCKTTGTVCSPQFAGLFQKPQEPSVHLSLLACYTYRNHWNHLFTSVCWPVPEITGTLCSPQFAGLLQKPRGALFSSVCRPVAEETGTICSPLFAGLLLKPLGPLFTSVCWPVAETTGEGGSGQQLKEHLVDELDYMLVPAEAWNKLVAWYTLMPGQVCSRQRNGCCLCG